MTDHRLANHYCRMKAEGVRLQLVADDDVIGQLLANALELDRRRFDAPELRKIESEDAAQARRIEETY